MKSKNTEYIHLISINSISSQLYFWNVNKTLYFNIFRLLFLSNIQNFNINLVIVAIKSLLQNIPHRHIPPINNSFWHCILFYYRSKASILVTRETRFSNIESSSKTIQRVDSCLRIAKSFVRRAHARRIGLVEGRHPLLKLYAGLLIKLSQWIRRPGVTAYNRETNELLSIAVGVALCCFVLIVSIWKPSFVSSSFAVSLCVRDEDEVLSVCYRIQWKMESFRIDGFFPSKLA